MPQRRLTAALALSVLIHLAFGFLPLSDEQRPAPWRPSSGRTELEATLRYVDTAASQDKRGLDHARQAAPPTASRGPVLFPVLDEPYYPSAQLTKRPQPTAGIDLEGPGLRPVVASGTIVLRLWIDARGTVVDAEPEATEMPPAFAAAAILAFKQARFIPGELHGRPVGTVMRVEIRYEDGRSPAP